VLNIITTHAPSEVDRAVAIGIVCKKDRSISLVIFKLCKCTDKQTEKQTDILITIFCAALPGSEVTMLTS